MELSEREWLFPLANPSGPEEGLAAYAVIYHRRSEDTTVVPTTPVGDRNRADEVAVVKTTEGSIVALIRSNWGPVLWQSLSEDDGQSWGTPWKTVIPSQSTPADVIHLHNGWLLCTFSFQERRDERQILSKEGE